MTDCLTPDHNINFHNRTLYDVSLSVGSSQLHGDGQDARAVEVDFFNLDFFRF